jgi:hypothetical protein
MMLILTRRHIPVIAGMVALLACGRDQAREAGGDYQLSAVGDGPLPSLLRTEPPCSFSLVAGSVRLTGNDYEAAYDIVRVCPDGVEQVMDQGGSGTYTTAGDSIFFFDEAGDPAGTAILRSDTLLIHGPQHSLLFVRF